MSKGAFDYLAEWAEGTAIVNQFITRTQPAEPPPLPDCPRLAPQALYGLAGDVVRTIEPVTESDPAAILIQLLVMFGNVIGSSPHYIVEGTAHSMNEFAVLVGASSKARKGTSERRVRQFLQPVDDKWVGTRIQGGLSSGEGLIYAVRDPLGEDAGECDKRLLISQGEFVSALRVMQREGNTLSAILREAWDSGNLRVLTKNIRLVSRLSWRGILSVLTRGLRR